MADQEQFPFDVGSLVDFRLVSARCFLQGRFQQLPMYTLSTLWLVRKLTIKAFTSCWGNEGNYSSGRMSELSMIQK